MGFKNNYSEATQNSGLKPEGTYECLLVKAEEHQFRSGTIGLNLTYVIRNDLEQKYKNGYIFDTLWKRKEPTQADMQVNGYGFGQIMNLGKAAKLPDGKDYDNLEQFLQDLVNKPFRLTIKHEEYNGEMREKVSYVNETIFPQVNHIMKPTASNNVSNTPAPPKAEQFATTSAVQQSMQQMSNLEDEDIPF